MSYKDLPSTTPFRYLRWITAGQYKRFEKPRRQPYRGHIVDPSQAAPPGAETQHAWIGDRLALDRTGDRGARRVVGQVGARIDIAVADAVLEGDAPAPAEGHRDRARQRLDVARGRFARQRGGAITRQPVRPILARKRVG